MIEVHNANDAPPQAGLFEGFEEHQLPREQDFTDALSAGLVSLDANVLLNLYKLDSDTRDTWLDLLERLNAKSNSLWVTNQAIKEFWNNRVAAAMYPEVATRAKDEIEKARAQIAKQFRSWTRTLSGGIDALGTPLGPVDKAIDEVVNRIDDFIGKHQDFYSESPDEDLIVAKLGVILDGRVGPAADAVALEALYKNGETRFSNKVPPGYLDDDKGSVKKYGDYVLWEQVLDECRRRSGSGSPTLLIVTADAKVDWWRKSFGGGENIGPRLELLREARDRARVSLMLISPGDFLGLLGRFLDVSVDQRMIDSTSEAGAELLEQQWTPAEIRVVLDRLAASPYSHLVEVLREASADDDGLVAREDIAEIVGMPIENFRRFSLPIRTQSNNAAQAGDIAEGLPDLLVAVYPPVGGNLTGYRIPIEFKSAVREAFDGEEPTVTAND